MTIIAAIKRVLRAAKEPLTIRQIHEQIIANDFFVFNTPNPETVIGHALRRHCIGIELKWSGKQRWFKMVENKRYELAGGAKLLNKSGSFNAPQPNRGLGINDNPITKIETENASAQPVTRKLENSRLTIIEAILAVMREARIPLSAHEAYEKIIKKKNYEFHAQKPEHVISSQIRRHCKGIDFTTASPTKYFTLSNDGKYSPLNTPLAGKPEIHQQTSNSNLPSASLAASIKELKHLHVSHIGLLKARLLRDLKKFSPAAFETFGKRLLEKYGFEKMRVTRISKDGGIDGDGKLKVGLAYMRVAFQCKRWTRTNVRRREVDEFRGAISGDYQQGIYFTTARFAAGAKAVSIKPGAVPIILIDGPGIVELMIEKSFGVEQESLPIYSYALDLVVSDENRHEES